MTLVSNKVFWRSLAVLLFLKWKLTKSKSLFSVARGSIKKVDQQEDHSSVTVEIRHLYRQKTQVFVSGGVRVRNWSGQIKMPLQCGVKSGDGEFLFTGTVRFGEAWMGCAPRYKDFLRLYHEAQQQGTNPCYVDTEWAGCLLGNKSSLRRDWQTGPVAEPPLPLCADNRRSSWMLPSSTLAVHNVGMCLDCMMNCRGFKCSRTLFGSMCIKCEWNIVHFEALCAL